MKTLRYTLFLVIVAVLNSLAQGFDTVKISKELEERKELYRNQSIANTYSSSGMSNILSLISNITVSSSFEAGSSASAKIAIPGKRDQINIDVEQKLTAANSQEATPFNLDGISPDAKVTFAYQHMYWNPENVLQIPDTVLENMVRDFMKRNKIPESQRPYLMKSSLDSIATQIIENYDYSFVEPTYLNANVSLSRSSFEYTTDSLTLKTITQKKLGYSLGFSMGKVISNAPGCQQLLVLNYSYSENYKSTDQITFLSPFGTTKNLTSQDIAFGLPVFKTDQKITFEYKIGLMPGRTSPVDSTMPLSFGIDPALTYSFKQKKIAFLAPIYFLQAKGKNGSPTDLNGGIRIGYSTPFDVTDIGATKFLALKEGFDFELFIGLPFQVFSNLN